MAGFIFANMRYYSYLNTAKKIIETYKGEVPFTAFLKKFFAANKKYGSQDRKQIAALCYNFYRLGKALSHATIEEKIITEIFLCEQADNPFLKFHKPEWNEMITKELEEKIKISGIDVASVFSFTDELSSGIDPQSFCTSFFYQPDLFLRIRPGQKNIVTKKLYDAGISFELKADDCIALSNATKLDDVLETDKEVIVQDYNSQKVLDVLKNKKPGEESLTVWDCCAASGGKSMLVYDILKGEIELTVSDIRESILSNLKKRFVTAGIKKYNSFIADLSIANPQGPADYQLTTINFQLILCDAPCTGSGTWSRTPEQLYFFKKKTIEVYTDMQQKIVSHVIPCLQKDGIFIYITCSVFKKENENIVNFIKEKFHLQLLQMELLKGYDKKADSMFVAVFKN
jgi:16S rRNA (cytosine967-C5)-methyltransferase